MAVLLWFKRDLRITDNAALLRACQLGSVVPVYIVEPDLWVQPDASARQYEFLCETLTDLRTDLRALGSELVVRVGPAVAVLEMLRQESGATRLVSTEETGNSWTFARDKHVRQWARDAGLVWEEVPHSAIRRGRHDRDGWAAYRSSVVFREIQPPPTGLPPVSLTSDAVPSPADLGLAPDPCPGRQAGGRREAERLFDSFLETRGRTYRRAMSSPLDGAQACSRLSPHLAVGSLSPREVVQATAARQEISKQARDGWSSSLRSFQSRLAWRDHFIQKLEDEPELEWRELHSAHVGLRPIPADAARLAAWERGETGLPFVDACMRALISTGWLNFRMRAMLMSVASYHLWLPWQRTGQHLARLFTDYEPGIHWSQCQMQSGTTGINTIRVYNPVKQGKDQDPTGAFTRRWCPELGNVPDRVLQEPWLWDGALDYPSPVVDVHAAAKAARDRLWALRRVSGFADETARVVRKHASRKDPARHFVNDRAPRKPGDSRQLSFDL